MLPEFCILNTVNGNHHFFGDEDACTAALAAEQARTTDPLEVMGIEAARNVSYELALEQYCTGPQEINQERFAELLNIMPPCKWVMGDRFSCFHLSETIAHNLVTWVMKLKKANAVRYFTIVERDNVPWHELMLEAITYSAANPNGED